MLYAATISVCLTSAPSSCESHAIRIEARACHLPAMRAEVELGGTWTPAVARILCQTKPAR